jgi:hypothetical protein
MTPLEDWVVAAVAILLAEVVVVGVIRARLRGKAHRHRYHWF